MNLKLKAQSSKLQLKTQSIKGGVGMKNQYSSDSKTRAYRFALMVIKLVDKLPRDTTCLIIGKQLIRSATSFGANIVEAQSGSSRRDFINFFNHALKSSNESKFWLNLLKDSEKTSISEIREIVQECEEISKILASSLLTLKGKRRF